jgi:predicted acylesterase/phospholipase RssA
VVFPSVEIGVEYLMDGAICGNTPVVTAAELGAERLIVLPTGFACALSRPPGGAAARGFHALTLIVAHQLVQDLAHLSGAVRVVTVPSLCPLDVSPFDFSKTEALMTAPRAKLGPGSPEAAYPGRKSLANSSHTRTEAADPRPPQGLLFRIISARIAIVGRKLCCSCGMASRRKMMSPCLICSPR